MEVFKFVQTMNYLMLVFGAHLCTCTTLNWSSGASFTVLVAVNPFFAAALVLEDKFTFGLVVCVSFSVEACIVPADKLGEFSKATSQLSDSNSAVFMFETMAGCGMVWF